MKKFIIAVFLCPILLTPVYARWAAHTDADTKSTRHLEIFVNADGSTESIISTFTKILRESARDEASQAQLTYNSDNEKVEILEAKTIFGDKQYPIAESSIEDKPLASSHDGFDQTNQILLAFQNVEVGSTLYHKIKWTKKKSELDDFFGNMFYFGNDDLEEMSQIKIVSKLPLFLLPNDPDHALEIKESEDKAAGTYIVEIKLIKPLFKETVNEPGDSFINEKHLTWVSISSLDNWEEFGIKQSKPFAKVLAQELPDMFTEILNKAQEKDSDVEKIDTVTSLLNDRVRYLGDWRSISGRYAPRNLETVSETQFGDCKDLATVTAAILNKIGFKAQIALVFRGMDIQQPKTLPNFRTFNHAMVKAIAEDGKIYWIDPTNFVSMAGRIFPDIAGKMALVLDPKQSIYEKIPNVDSNSAKIIATREWEVFKNDSVIETGSQKFENEMASVLTGASLRTSDEIIRDNLFASLSGSIIQDKFKRRLEIPKLDSRIVQDVSFNYSFEKENEVIKTNVGPALTLDSSISTSQFYDFSPEHVSDFPLEDFPRSIRRQTIIKNIEVQNIDSLNKDIDSPWLHFNRECQFNENGDLQIDDTFTVHKHIISSEDLKDPAFIRLREQIIDELKNVVIVFKNKDKDEQQLGDLMLHDEL